MTKKQKNKIIFTIIVLILIGITTLFEEEINYLYNKIMNVQMKSYNIDDIPLYEGNDFVYINENKPEFSFDELTEKSFEKYSNLDYLGRCGTAYANISKDIMPKTEREPIGMVKPSGWQTIKYNFIDGKFLYNRCHLIGYQLSGENANEKNLITCTRQMNTVGMLQFENKVSEYVKKTGNHVLYRVSPIYDGKNLLASGVQMEAKSVEDNGRGISFNVYVYNVQDGVIIDYKTGESKLASK